MIRKNFEGNKLILFGLDIYIILILISLVFTKFHILRTLKIIPRFIAVFILVYFGLILFQVFNFVSPDLITTISGLRNYILPLTGILLGTVIAHEWEKNDYLKLSNILIITSFILIIIAIVQLMVDPQILGKQAAQFLLPSEHSVHSWGNDVSVTLTSGTFASSKRFGKFLLFSFIIIMAIRKTYDVNSKKIFWLFFIGIIISASREALMLFFLVNMVLFWKNKLSYYLMITVLFIILISYYLISLSDQTHNLFTFYLSTPEDLINRIQLLFPIFNINFSNDHIYLGLGLGKYGQDTVLSPNILEYSKILVTQMFYNGYYFVDSGMTKTIIEFGVYFGGFILLFYIYIIFYGIRLYMKSIAFKYLWLIFFVWLIMYFKLHSTMNDIYISYIYFLVLGFMISQYKIKRKKYEN
ncbi:hypothetical protein [Poseidonibacter lekithochrous]|uniref:hypothetical protein n=1 Tax=Poseidonibacter lekithochrous TaxID=1904463 RepID=UPI0013DA25AD|nr:hypothetical protein [Poseidonibacter lekithochrous]